RRVPHGRAVSRSYLALHPGAGRAWRAAVAWYPGPVSIRPEPRARTGLVHDQTPARDAVRRAPAPRWDCAAVPGRLRRPVAARGRGAQRSHGAGPGPARAVGRRVAGPRGEGADR